MKMEVITHGIRLVLVRNGSICGRASFRFSRSYSHRFIFWYLWRQEALSLVFLKKENLVEQESLSFYRVPHPLVISMPVRLGCLFSHSLAGLGSWKRCLVVCTILGREHGFSSRICVSQDFFLSYIDQSRCRSVQFSTLSLFLEIFSAMADAISNPTVSMLRLSASPCAFAALIRCASRDWERVLTAFIPAACEVTPNAVLSACLRRACMRSQTAMQTQFSFLSLRQSSQSSA